VYSDVVNNAYIAHPHYARFFKCNYWFNSFDSKFWDCIDKFPIAIYNASNLCVLSYIVSLSVFNARYLRMLHYDKLREFMFKGKQYSSFQQLSCSTCCNMLVNCQCYDLIGLATATKLVLAGNNCRSFKCWVNNVFGMCTCLDDSGKSYFCHFNLYNFYDTCEDLVFAGFNIVDVISVEILKLKFIVKCLILVVLINY
jgi:hypothetical protein